MNYQPSHFICDICDAEFTTAGQLKIHQACIVHERQDILRSNSIKQEGRKLFKCDICNYNVFDKATLSQHVIEHDEQLSLLSFYNNLKSTQKKKDNENKQKKQKPINVSDENLDVEMITIDKEKYPNDSNHSNENLETDNSIPYLEMTCHICQKMFTEESERVGHNCESDIFKCSFCTKTFNKTSKQCAAKLNKYVDKI